MEANVFVPQSHKKKKKNQMWLEAWNSLNFEYKGIVITYGC